MDITEIDKNLKSTKITETDIVWRNARENPFSLHGVFYDEDAKRYCRMPLNIAYQVSDSVGGLATFTAGGRVRFTTDSPYVAIKAVQPKTPLGSNGSFMNCYGFSVYSNGIFEGNLRAEYSDYLQSENEKVIFSSIAYGRLGGLRTVEIYFPLYCGVNELFIGLKEGCVLEKAKAYAVKTPIVFYGSSITQGGCASRAGTDYVSILSRRLDSDFVNLGFSGSAKAEKEMADYLSSLKASVMVLDYDFNSPTEETLKATHYPLYERIRTAQPNTPILFMTRPNFAYDPKSCIPRREIIKQTYLQAIEKGDKKVEFIDGESFFGKEDWYDCTVDNCHPNDLGFYRMAEKIEPFLKKHIK